MKKAMQSKLEYQLHEEVNLDFYNKEENLEKIVKL
jgi:hypothetical protein